MKITDTIRIREFDRLNVVIEERYMGKEKDSDEEVEKWKIIGYYPNTRIAIKDILENDMLIDMGAVETLEDYQKSFEEQVQLLIDRMDVTF